MCIAVLSPVGVSSRSYIFSHRMDQLGHILRVWSTLHSSSSTDSFNKRLHYSSWVKNVMVLSVADIGPLHVIRGRECFFGPVGIWRCELFKNWALCLPTHMYIEWNDSIYTFASFFSKDFEYFSKNLQILEICIDD